MSITDAIKYRTADGYDWARMVEERLFTHE